MIIRKATTIKASEITEHAHFKQRRKIISTFAGIGTLAGVPQPALAEGWFDKLIRNFPGGDSKPTPKEILKDLTHTVNPNYRLNDALTDKTAATTYNNFYEFGLDKSDPAKYAPGNLPRRPWSIQLSGEIEKPQNIDIEDLLKLAPIEERIYRFRCVEGWSMVIPWLGYSLANLIKLAQPTSNAKFVEFETLADASVMPGLSNSLFEWPYREALRMDEAMHPLTLLAVGMYGQEMPAQNGAPIRLIVPWKYGFKSAKSIVRIRFTEKQPTPTWVAVAGNEYGFYSNVNPNVAHKRWSQSKERPLTGSGSLFTEKKPTLLFNGYEEVASLYTGMDLHKYF